MAQAVTIAANVNGFDTLSIVPATFAACMARAGYRFCGRYISLAKPEAPGYLTVQKPWLSLRMDWRFSSFSIPEAALEARAKGQLTRRRLFRTSTRSELLPALPYTVTSKVLLPPRTRYLGLTRGRQDLTCPGPTRPGSTVGPVPQARPRQHGTD